MKELKNEEIIFQLKDLNKELKINIYNFENDEAPIIKCRLQIWLK